MTGSFTSQHAAACRAFLMAAVPFVPEVAALYSDGALARDGAA